jgi:signal transduction histidine kinase
VPGYTPIALFILLLIFIALAVYGVKIASFFNQQRERMLEARNKQLTALHRMSSTIRSAESLRNVIHHILVNVLAGLGFETVILLLIDRSAECVRMYAPGKHPMFDEIVKALGKPLDEIQLPLEVLEADPLKTIMKQQIVFRKDIVEVTEEMRNVVSADVSQRLQELLKVKKVIGIPLVAEQEVLGALVGFARERYVRDATMETFESFANQAALNIEASRLIDELKKTNEQLKEANRVKSEFLAIMSHELRTPLTAIIGFSELLLEGVMGDLNDEQKDSLKEVMNNGGDLLEMINSLLDLSKVESGKMEIEFHPFVLGEVVDRIERAISSLIQRKDLNLKIEVPDDLPPLSGDERKVQQILLNLLSNAIKFTPGDGTIKIRVDYFKSWDDLGELKPWNEKLEPNRLQFKEGAAVIRVEDTGMGIKPEHLELIFDMFQQVDSSMTRSYGGTGLGLALSKKFVDLHRGLIWAESTVGKGTCFYVALPLAKFPR